MIFFPVFDDNPTKKKPLICWFIIFLCFIIFLFQESLNYHEQRKLILSYGMIPSVLLGYNELSFNLVKIPAILTILTSMFMHGGWMHLIGNIGYLYIFGDNIEDCMGRLRFIIFYLICGLIAALSQCSIDINSSTPMIGASGAISGILGGYLILYPKAKVKVFFWFIIFVKTFNIPALYVLGAWILIQFFSFDASASNGVAYAAHIGGFIAGIVLIKFFKKNNNLKAKKLDFGSLPSSK